MKEDIRKTVLERKRRAKSKGNNKPTSKADLRSKVGDLRSVIAKKTKSKQPAARDLRDSNKKLSSRKKPSAQAPSPASNSNRKELSRPSLTRTTRSSGAPGTKSSQRSHPHQQPEQEYYVPPHIRRSQPAYAAPHAAVAPRASSLVVNPPEPQHRSASVLVSNLNPTITQSDIIELFGEIGVMTAVNMINQNSALVTYQSNSDAFRAVRVYHNRLLDGRPMLVNIMPSPV